jgi:hypothetical protein
MDSLSLWSMLENISYNETRAFALNNRYLINSIVAYFKIPGIVSK